MSEHVTRARAREALEVVFRDGYDAPGVTIEDLDQCIEDEMASGYGVGELTHAFAILRAYILHGPNEETTYESFRATSPENAALLAAAREQLGECCARHAKEPSAEVIRRGHEALERQRGGRSCAHTFDEPCDLCLIAAAMYQPEEE